VKRGLKFKIGHPHIAWSNGEDEECGTILFLLVVTRV
jgi:hypothetical protein